MPFTVPSLRELARRALPHALEAAIVAAILCVLASQVAGPRVAIFAPLASRGGEDELLAMGGP